MSSTITGKDWNRLEWRTEVVKVDNNQTEMYTMMYSLNIMMVNKLIYVRCYLNF